MKEFPRMPVTDPAQRIAAQLEATYGSIDQIPLWDALERCADALGIEGDYESDLDVRTLARAVLRELEA